MKRIVLLLFLVLFLANCKSTKETTTTPVVSAPAEAQVTLALNRWPGTTLTELQEGHKIYTGQCTNCHTNFPVEKFSEKKWLHEIDDMSPKAKLSADQKLRLTKYLLSMRDSKVKQVAN